MYSDVELAPAPFAGSWLVGQILLHIEQEDKGEIHHQRTGADLDSIAETDLSREVATPWGSSYEMGDMVFPELAHEIHHRGELSLILVILGREGFDV